MGLPPKPHGGHLGQELEGPKGANHPPQSTVSALEWVPLIDPFGWLAATSTLTTIEFHQREQY